ncbi:MAG: UDP-glucose--hexose-1-phosphate uridylyltransferase [Fimbriimonadales bacterium]|nr:UDP-glucose--hexose-1-phosphate uridylyltransferase [Fimbriimonadales bacterium]
MQQPPQLPHRRFNPLTGEWILVSPHRTQRPWQGQREAVADARARYDPQCYLCPGNVRASGERNPPYSSTFAFTNDFAALLPDTPSQRDGSDLYRWESVAGTCRVLCFSPRHDLTLAQMPVDGIRSVVDLWAAECEELGRTYSWVQVFENKGAAMGCSNPHPHGQIWASGHVPEIPGKEDARFRSHYASRGSTMLQEVAERELEFGRRVVVETRRWLALVPFWAVWPFETLVLPKFPAARLEELDGGDREDLAECLKRLLVRYDNLFETSFPYSFGWHGAPYQAGAHRHWTLHAHLFPPLLRSATVRKFMVGYEMLGEPQRDITPEAAAERLRSLPETHYAEES